MKRDELLSYASDFSSMLLDASAGSIRGIILFGSVARGNFDGESDVDIFVDTTKPAFISKIVDKVIGQFEAVSEKRWKPRGIDLPIRCITDNISLPKWESLRRDMESYGIVLYGKYKEISGNLEHYMIMILDFGKLKPKEKVKVMRKLYGYRIKKKKKEYNIAGILDKLEGKKLNQGTIMIPMGNYHRLQKMLNMKKTSVRLYECWMRNQEQKQRI